MSNIYSVTDVNNEIKSLLEGNPSFRNIFVRGEISNHKGHSSGHHYMTLKDNESVLSAVMFRFDVAKLKFKLENGMKVIARGRISSFPKNGQYQMYISDMVSDGSGDLHLAFEQLKEQLYKEGLFDEKHKRPLPRFPQNIAVITSPTGAAVRDIIRILKQRYPVANVRVYPVLVQGTEAPREIAEAIQFVNEENICDVIITGRGGGSIEDLWAFNDEHVARTIFASEIPVISAVGHEPDITISDFVADARASTPSNAAEICVPDKRELQSFLQKVDTFIENSVTNTIKTDRIRLENLNARFKTPINYIQDKRILLDHINDKLIVLSQNNLLDKRQRFAKAVAYLDAFSPLKVLSRGYSLVSDEKGKIVSSANNLKEDDKIKIRFSKGTAICSIDSIER